MPQENDITMVDVWCLMEEGFRDVEVKPAEGYKNLEAQLKEREKQYEYYWNKLLTFVKAE